MPRITPKKKTVDTLLELVRARRHQPEVSLFGNLASEGNDAENLIALVNEFVPSLVALGTLDDVVKSLQMLEASHDAPSKDSRNRQLASHRATQKGRLVRQLLTQVTLRIELFGMLQDTIINATGGRLELISAAEAKKMTNLSVSKIKTLRTDTHFIGPEIQDLTNKYCAEQAIT